MVVNLNELKHKDPVLANLLVKELTRQKNTINLIASENYTSLSVLEATASVLTNKYAEGYPSRRYYSGNTYVDMVEKLAIDRARKLFGAEHANVQALSGSPANMAAYMSLLDLEDKVLSMELAHGGHLTHGSPYSFSGKMYNFVHYGVSKDTGRLDMEEIREIAINERPKLIVCGASAYPREINFKKFKDIAEEAGAYLMADIAHIAGLVAAEEHPSSIPYTDITTSTTQKTLRGPRSGLILCKEKHAKKVDFSVFPGISGGPHEHIIAAKAAAFKEAMTSDFKNYQGQIIKNAKVLSQELIKRDFTLVSGGTDNHLMLVDLTNKGVTGRATTNALSKANIIANRNMIPFDKRSPMDPSGIRLGTPALTTRGFKEEYISQNKEMFELYDKLSNSVIASEAIGVLPHSLQIYNIAHINAWNATCGFIPKRFCMQAQWEIRSIASSIVSLYKEKSLLSEYMLPRGDTWGVCPEFKPCPSRETAGKCPEAPPVNEKIFYSLK